MQGTKDLTCCRMLFTADAPQSEGRTADQAQEPSAAAPTAQAEGKENTSAETNGRSAASVRRKTEEELPEGIKALRSKFTGTPSSSNSGLPQVCHHPFTYSTTQALDLAEQNLGEVTHRQDSCAYVKERNGMVCCCTQK